MGKAQNDIEEFIYKICYQSIWKAVNAYISVHPTALNLSMSRIHYSDDKEEWTDEQRME